MKITFVAIGSDQLAVCLLANMAKKAGHQVNLAYNIALFHDRFNLEIPWLNKIFDDTEETFEQILSQAPEVLVFSSLTATYQWMLEMARRTKEVFPNVKVIFGGVHPSAVTERVIKRPQVDFVVRGEGEVCFIPILKAIENEDDSTPIPNTWFKDRNGNIIKGKQQSYYQELEALPPFTKEIWEPYVFVADRYFTMATRGCPYRCTFCFNNFFAELPDDKKSRGKYVRSRSIDHMLDELKYAKSRYKKLRWIDFQDDIFTVNKRWLKDFLHRYKEEINIPFQCLVHPRYMDEDIAKWLVDAGCKWVQMGIQTMDEELKVGHLRRNEKSDQVTDSLKIMIEFGLNVKVDHMFGLPGEAIEAQELARELYANHCPKRIQTFWTCFLPGTEMLQQGIDEGMVTLEEAERLNEGEDFYFYRTASNIKNPEDVRKYKAYELLFKLYPMLPKFIRTRFKVKHVMWIPDPIKHFIGFFGDLINGLASFNPDFIAYAKYYLFHITYFFARKMGMKKKWRAVIPKDDTPYDYKEKKYIQAVEFEER
ncbi:MAG: B12-binding domain-containing radical SAM protein [Chitinophagales bacterium]|nr:B12-binding domain-containing radical SAM protein [Chitinophagales bacterium]